MAWGVWNKIKNGFKKVGSAIKKAANWVSDKVIKPFKPLISAGATAVNPALGAAVNTGMHVVDRLSDGGAQEVNFTPFRRLRR